MEKLPKIKCVIEFVLDQNEISFAEIISILHMECCSTKVLEVSTMPTEVGEPVFMVTKDEVISIPEANKLATLATTATTTPVVAPVGTPTPPPSPTPMARPKVSYGN